VKRACSEGGNGQRGREGRKSGLRSGVGGALILATVTAREKNHGRDFLIVEGAEGGLAGHR